MQQLRQVFGRVKVNNVRKGENVGKVEPKARGACVAQYIGRVRQKAIGLFESIVNSLRGGRPCRLEHGQELERRCKDGYREPIVFKKRHDAHRVGYKDHARMREELVKRVGIVEALDGLDGDAGRSRHVRTRGGKNSVESRCIVIAPDDKNLVFPHGLIRRTRARAHIAAKTLNPRHVNVEKVLHVLLVIDIVCHHGRHVVLAHLDL